jgi:chemotaxis protein MotB
MSDDKRPIIIKKVKKGGHGAHHGGAWKIAYADFVTAMMAFFLLMWLLNAATKEQLEGISEYFAPTIGVEGSPVKRPGELESQASVDKHPIEGSVVASEQQDVEAPNNIEQQNFSNALAELQKMITTQAADELSKRVFVDMTPEGLRIQIFDDSDRPLFKPSTNELQEYTKKLLDNITMVIKVLPNFLSIGGHTRGQMQKETDAESENKWIVSAARATAVRDYMTRGAIQDDQVARVVGYADHNLYDPKDPTNVRNMRISIILLKSELAGTTKSSSPQKILTDKIGE